MTHTSASGKRKESCLPRSKAGRESLLCLTCTSWGRADGMVDGPQSRKKVERSDLKAQPLSWAGLLMGIPSQIVTVNSIGSL